MILSDLVHIILTVDIQNYIQKTYSSKLVKFTIFFEFVLILLNIL